MEIQTSFQINSVTQFVYREASETAAGLETCQHLNRPSTQSPHRKFKTSHFKAS